MKRRLHILAFFALLIPAMSSVIAEGTSPPAGSYFQKVRTFHTPAEFERMTSNRVKMHRGVGGGAFPGLDRFLSYRPLPWNEITVRAPAHSLGVWVGTTRGAVRLISPGEPYEYFAGKRWLPADHVTGIGFDSDGRVVWLETEEGFSRIEYEVMTLGEKAGDFEDRVRKRHVRHGFTADSRLLKPGDLSSNRMISTDNDGLWTAMYLAAECFRFNVTGEKAAAKYAEQALEALMRLEQITGIPGFPARSIIQIGVDEQPTDGEWHTTSDNKWRWKGDTSSDEIVGHYYGYSVFHDLVADESQKAQIAKVVDRITNHILNNGYHLVDLDGKPTRWGWWAPEEIWREPDETGLRALHLLSHLKVAIHITQNNANRERFKASYADLINNHRYDRLTLNQKINYPGHINHSDDELAFLSYYPLLRYETDSRLKRIYETSLERSWSVEQPERNPLWNFIYAAGTGDDEFSVGEAILTLQQIPTDLVKWTMVNSHRLDVPINTTNDRFARVQSLAVLPYDELPVMKWNGNPYRLDGGNRGKSEDDGAFFLLPYWMGRYYGYIPE
jgi:hypothetical protein